MLCVTNTTVFRRSLHSWSSSIPSSSRVMASRAPNGSSMRSSGGSWISARQNDTRYCIPPESSRGMLSSYARRAFVD